jgi:alpha-beta hydrolase superfamily lysophospholipase
MPEYEEQTIRLPDGYEAYARYWPADSPRGSVLYLHGIQSHCGWYERSASMLRQAGYAVLQPDRRGSGRNEKERGHAASAEQLIEDAFVCADILGDRCGRRTHALLGVSWGGKLAVAMHAADERATAALVPITPGLFPIVDVSAAEKFRIGISMISNPTALYDIPLNDPELFTHDPNWMKYLREDQLQLHQATAGFFLASRRMDKIVARLAARRSVPIHLMLAGEERIIDNEATRRFARELPWNDVTITTYDNARHTLEFDATEDGFLDDLINWLNVRIR